MPSQRPATLNPRAPAPVVAPARAPADTGAAFPTAQTPTAQTPTAKRGAKAPPTKALPGDAAAVEAAGASGFHESSYELQNGLQITESEWPDDVTVPGALDDR